MSEPDPAPPPTADSDPGHVKRRSKTSRRVKTKVRTLDNRDERRKLRKKVLGVLKWVGLWVLALVAIWVGLRLFVRPPPLAS